MLTIKSPETYINEYDILSDAGQYISEYGRKALIIAGKTAWSKAGDLLTESLDKSLISFDKRILEGYPTYEKVLQLESIAFQYGADMVIGVGGGKVCDVAKAVGNYRNIPVVMIPTIAATCACWAARSILYTEEGDFDFVLWNKQNPRLIIADTRIIKEAPARYLAAGIMDTYAKWYEFEPQIKNKPGDVVLKQDVAIAKVAFDLLKEHGMDAYRNKAEDEEFKQVVEAIFFLAGATGSFANGAAYRGFAHSYYYASTRIPESRHLLHGEKVAFGLLVQFILQKKDIAFSEGYAKELAEYNQTDIPENWKTESSRQKIKRIAGLVMEEWPAIREYNLADSAEEVEKAIYEADRLIKAVS